MDVRGFWPLSSYLLFLEDGRVVRRPAPFASRRARGRLLYCTTGFLCLSPLGVAVVMALCREGSPPHHQYRGRKSKSELLNERYCRMLWIGLDHAASFSSFLSTNSPFTNPAPALTKGTSR
jgi:hypothetical protein